MMMRKASHGDITAIHFLILRPKCKPLRGSEQAGGFSYTAALPTELSLLLLLEACVTFSLLGIFLGFISSLIAGPATLQQVPYDTPGCHNAAADRNWSYSFSWPWSADLGLHRLGPGSHRTSRPSGLVWDYSRKREQMFPYP